MIKMKHAMQRWAAIAPVAALAAMGLVYVLTHPVDWVCFSWHWLQQGLPLTACSI